MSRSPSAIMASVQATWCCNPPVHTTRSCDAETKTKARTTKNTTQHNINDTKGRTGQTYPRRKRLQDALERDLEVLAVILVPKEVYVFQCKVNALRKLLQAYPHTPRVQVGTGGGVCAKEG